MNLKDAVDQANRELGKNADAIKLLNRTREIIEASEVKSALGGNAEALRGLLLRVARSADEGRPYPWVPLGDGVFSSQEDAAEHQRAHRLAHIVNSALGDKL